MTTFVLIIGALAILTVLGGFVGMLLSLYGGLADTYKDGWD